MTPEEVGRRVVALLAPVEATASVSGGQGYARATVDVPPASWRDAVRAARGDAELGCDFFDWLSAVDELAEGFDIVTHLWSTRHRHGLLLRTRVPRETPVVASVVDVFPGAAWHERETHEMFGIGFDGHGELRPLLLPPEFEGHPLRKEFVLASRVAKPWPGAKEPGESEAGGGRRVARLPREALLPAAELFAGHARPDLLQSGRPGRVEARLLDLQHPALDGVAGQFGPAHRVGVAALDPVPYLVQRRGGAGRGERGHRLQRAGHGLLHLGLLELAEQLGALGEPLLEDHRVVLDRLAGLRGRAERLVVQGLEVLHRLLGGDQLAGEQLRGLLVAPRLGLLAAAPGLVGQDQGLPGVALELLDLGHLPGQLHLQLALVADHRGRLLDQRLVLTLGLLDGLLDLHLRVGVLVDLRAEERHQVFPALDERVRHLRLVPSVASRRLDRGRPASRAVCLHRPSRTPTRHPYDPDQQYDAVATGGHDAAGGIRRRRPRPGPRGGPGCCAASP
ncbi:NADH-quinone oxidoreductase chain 5 [Micromonospora sp. MH33]|nr:NADH-quinone oxidoreductase chain 5 [Micromonospora sp. MH33]